MNETYDTVIIGGGIAGASLAYFLSPHQSVLVLEMETQFGYHSTGRSAAEYTERFHSPTTGILTKASYDFFTRPPEGFSEVDLLIRRGNLIIADEEKAAHLLDVFNDEYKKSSGLLLLNKHEAVRRAPILKEEYVAAAFYDPDCWDIEVDNLLQGFLKGAKHNDADLQTGIKILSIQKAESMWIIETSTGKIKAAKIVNCAGAWADNVAILAGISPLGLTPFRRTAITVDLPEGIDAHDLPEISEVDELFYFKPEGGKIMASPVDETETVPCDAQPEDLDVAYAAYYLEISTTLDIKKISHKWAGLRTFSKDKDPVVGFSKEDESFFWLAGQGGFGIQTSPVMGALASSLIMHGDVTSDVLKLGLTAAHLSPNRFTT